VRFLDHLLDEKTDISEFDGNFLVKPVDTVNGGGAQGKRTLFRDNKPLEGKKQNNTDVNLSKPEGTASSNDFDATVLVKPVNTTNGGDSQGERVLSQNNKPLEGKKENDTDANLSEPEETASSNGFDTAESDGEDENDLKQYIQSIKEPHFIEILTTISYEEIKKKMEENTVLVEACINNMEVAKTETQTTIKKNNSFKNTSQPKNPQRPSPINQPNTTRNNNSKNTSQPSNPQRTSLISNSSEPATNNKTILSDVEELINFSFNRIG